MRAILRFTSGRTIEVDVKSVDIAVIVVKNPQRVFTYDNQLTTASHRAAHARIPIYREVESQEVELPTTIAQEVRTEGQTIIIVLFSGKEVRVNANAFPRLAGASPQRLANFRLNAGGTGIHWDHFDEDLSVAGLVRTYG